MNLILAVILVGSPAGVIPPDDSQVVDLIKHNIQAAALDEVTPIAPPQQSNEYPPSIAVADCESGDIKADGTAVPYSYSLTAQNPTSSASGKYQFINSTWESTTGLPAPASQYSEEQQDQAFHTLWDDGNGSFHWNPSRSCWQGAIP